MFGILIPFGRMLTLKPLEIHLPGIAYDAMFLPAT